MLDWGGEKGVAELCMLYWYGALGLDEKCMLIWYGALGMDEKCMLVWYVAHGLEERLNRLDTTGPPHILYIDSCNYWLIIGLICGDMKTLVHILLNILPIEEYAGNCMGTWGFIEREGGRCTDFGVQLKS
nr:hypothetical protein CFP56_61473 [Quercus suber]